MSYILKLHTTGRNDLKGWEKSSQMTSEDITSIPDTIRKGAASKIGTSIPSPFARIYLFETAFQMVSENLSGDTMYHRLVSDCLDIFQLLYMHGDNPDISIKKWDKSTELNLLQNSNQKHQELAEALSLFFSSPKFINTEVIYLIYYKNKLVGGTSPLTGLYVSPNWRRIVQRKSWWFKTPNGDILFDNNYYALHERDIDFQQYMLKYIYAYNTAIAEQSEVFFNYFVNSRGTNNEINEILTAKGIDAQNYTPEIFLGEYDQIQVRSKNNETTYDLLFSGDCAICKPKAGSTEAVEESDFLMRPSVDYYKKIVREGNPLPTPLVLVGGNHKMKYLRTNWDSKTLVPDIGENLFNRNLPGFTSYNYPYITVSDFLEDQLIAMPFKLDKERFFTGTKSDFKYLLPIKKEYFNFFTVYDLKKHLKITQIDNEVKVVLEIPVSGRYPIVFTKTYETANPNYVFKQKGRVGFNIGIFPFYKITDQSTLNAYAIYLASDWNNTKLSFYNFEAISEGKAIDAGSSVRTKIKGSVVGSKVYSIEGTSFDCIEFGVEIGTSGVKTNGLILADMQKIKIAEGGYEYQFAVDFGTSNTHISYVKGELSNKGDDIKSFDITSEDRQMVLLSEVDDNKHDFLNKISAGAGAIPESIDISNKEFIPGGIEKGSTYSFPIRTATLEGNIGEAHLFQEINIGFAIDQFFDEPKKYQTNIKWGMTKTGNAKKRVEAFVREVLWLIKNKILMNDGSLKSKIVWMVPLSMKRTTRNKFENIWNSEVKKVFGENNGISLEMKYESVVPYYSLNALRSQNAINIDIGGGTTDVLFAYKETDEYYTTSFRFAGNDIWGHGLREREAEPNGFISLMDEKLGGKQDVLYKYFREFHSEDTCAFLFKHSKEYEFEGHIQENRSLVGVLFIHLAAIIYHLCRIIKDKGWVVPQYISFTGKGSEYLKLISSNEGDIKDLIELLFAIFLKKDDVSIGIVKLAENPKELTAEGAILESDSKNKLPKIPMIINHICVNNLDELKVKDLAKHFDDIEKNFIRFIKKLKKEEVLKLLREFDINLTYGSNNILELLSNESTESFKEMQSQIEEDYDPDEPLEESPFFWFFKESLYKISIALSK